jgi:hypothetical protein
MGPTGPQGDTGPTGPQGDTGPTGPQGDAGVSLSAFLRSFNNSAQAVDLEQPVLFANNSITYGNIKHIPGSGHFLLETSGYYDVQIKIYHEYSAQLGLFLNEVLIPGSVTGEPAAASIIMINTIIKVLDSDLLINSDSGTGVAAILELRNHSSYISPIILDGRDGSGSDLTQINASIVIIKLSNL